MANKYHTRIAESCPNLTNEIKSVLESLGYPKTLGRWQITEPLHEEYGRIITVGIKLKVSCIVQFLGYETITNSKNPRPRFRRIE